MNTFLPHSQESRVLLVGPPPLPDTYNTFIYEPSSAQASKSFTFYPVMVTKAAARGKGELGEVTAPPGPRCSLLKGLYGLCAASDEGAEKSWLDPDPALPRPREDPTVRCSFMHSCECGLNLHDTLPPSLFPACSGGVPSG